jgi:protein-tyrosine phosphatase
LIELGAGETADEGADLINEICVLGWHPVVAHPELIPWLAGDVAAAARLVSLGAALQVTGMSITGEFGRAPQRFTWSLLDAALVDFVASDSHDLRRRPPGLSKAYSLVADRWGAAAAEAMFVSNPRAVVENRPLR